VSISGDTVVVGASPMTTTTGIELGFGPTSSVGISGGADAWGQVAKLTASDGDELTTHFGFSVSICGDTVVVGAEAGRRQRVELGFGIRLWSRSGGR
jgi:hypothetical protein